MNVVVCVGDVLDHPADVLISTANPWLNMSGGVNGAIAARCGPGIQSELRDFLTSRCLAAVPVRTVVRTSPGPLPFRHIIHAVAIDPFYDSSIEIVRDTLLAAFDPAVSFGARSISTPTLATGYGHLKIHSFGHALAPLLMSGCYVLDINVVVRSSENATILNSILTSGG